MHVSFSPLNASCIVAFSEYGRRVAMNRHGHYELVVSWGEFAAVARGVAQTNGGEEAHKRMVQGLAFFAKRQRLTWPS